MKFNFKDCKFQVDTQLIKAFNMQELPFFKRKDQGA